MEALRKAVALGAWPACAQESGSRPLSGGGRLRWTVGLGLGLLAAGTEERLAVGQAHSALWSPGLSSLLEGPLEGLAHLVQAPGSLEGVLLTDILRKKGAAHEGGSCSEIVSIEEALFFFR